MKRYRIARVLKFLVFAVVVAVVLSVVVMSLWNWLMPTIFGSQPITLGQAFGVLVLARVLFGRLGGGPGWREHWRHRMTERWNQMTPEEREKFTAGMKGRRGFESGITGPTA